MMLTTGGITGALYGSLMRIQRGWSYRYQYRVIVGEERQNTWFPILLGINSHL